MSYSDSAKPKIRILADGGIYNILIQTLTDNANGEFASERVTQKAQALLDKITHYARLTTDSDGTECVDIRFFDNEAKELILQFIFHCAGGAVAADYYEDLKNRRAETD